MNQLLKCILAGTLVSVAAGCAMQPQSTDSVHARFVPERKDDFAFENDKVAFRVYGPALKNSAENNGTDCWFKRVDYPVIDKWYKGATEGVSYHEDHGEGYDPYHVGNSLGCGGIAIWDASASGDKLVQPNVYTSYEIINKTADKVIFELKYNYAQQNIQEVKRITLEKGNQLYKAESQFTQNGQPIQLDVAVGVTTHDGKATAKVNSEGDTLTTWETIDDSQVGTAVTLPKSSHTQFVEQKSKVKDRSHAVLVTKTDKAGKITYYAGFAWTKAGEITSFSEWQNYAGTYLDK